MRFYKIQIELEVKSASEAEEKKANGSDAYKVNVKTCEFNGVGKESFVTVSQKGEGVVTLCAITTEERDILDLSREYADCVGIKAKGMTCTETTFGNFCGALASACRCGYIEDDDEVLERFGLDKLSSGYGRSIDYGENLVNTAPAEKALIASAKKLFVGETLIPEIERIYAGSKSPSVMGHPVHYVVETDDRDTRKEIYKIVLDALFANKRITSSRYTYLDFYPGMRYSHMAYEVLYKVSTGGAVVVRYLGEDDNGEDDGNASGEREIIENICEMAKRYRNKVLTVLCFPRECTKLKAQFYENLGTMAFVEIREDFISGDAAEGFLASLAKRHGVRVDKKLFSDLSAERSYLATELQSTFDEWYNGKLKSTVYPQYKNFASVRKEVVRAKPQGSAYDELMEMIGLDSAKDVINKALNYYKMQKLYEERGVKRSAPALHMLFSGNPGTAKTTVARLFARIMRENGLLSRGQLVEVGRGDLVGKYVGWTAKTVLEKFEAAKGGVLFIDEAYALVDGRDGSYGDEAINTIVQEMENHRSDMVVIFAGYPDKMEGFLDKNPGMRSRIAFHVPFTDYDAGELCRIAEMISRQSGMRIDKGALEKLEVAFLAAKNQEDFGNGRFVRTVLEQAKMNQATRLLRGDIELISSDEIITITAEDIEIPELGKRDARRVGFCA